MPLRHADVIRHDADAAYHAPFAAAAFCMTRFRGYYLRRRAIANTYAA